MVKLRTALAAILLLTAPTANAQGKMSVSDVVRLADTDDYYASAIYGNWEGALWMHAYFEVRGAQPAFCVPEKLVMNVSGVRTMLERYIEADPATGQKSSGELGHAIIKAAQYTFPC